MIDSDASGPTRPRWRIFYDLSQRRALSVLRAEWPALLLLALPLPFIVRIFSSGHIVFYIDSYFPFNPAGNFAEYSGAWSDYNGIGTLNVTNLALLPYIAFVGVLHEGLGLSLSASQAVVDYSVLAGAGLLMYAFVRTVGPFDRAGGRIAAFAAGVAYAASPVFLDLYWYLNFPGAAGVFLAAPGLGFLIVRGLKTAREGRLSAPTITGIALLSLIAATSGLPYIASVVVLGAFFVTLGFSGAWPKTTRPDRRLLFVGAAGAAAVLANLYWLLPLASVTGYVGGPNAYNVTTDLRDLAHNSALATPFGVPSLLYFPGSNQFAHWAASYRAPDPLLALLGGILVAVTFSALLVKRGDERSRRRVPAAIPLGGGLALLTFLFLAGSNPYSPTDHWFLWVFHRSTILEAFLRGPYLTIGNAIAFLVAFLFGEGVAVCAAAFARRIPAVVVWVEPAASRPRVAARWGKRRRVGLGVGCAAVLIAVCMAFAWPMYTSAPVTDLKNPASPAVPDSALALGSFLHSHAGDATTVALPASNGLVMENWSPGYLGPPALPFLAGSPVLESFTPPLGASANDVVPLALTLPSFQATTGYDHLLQVLGAKYVVVDSSQTGRPPAAPFNLSAINYTLAHQHNVSFLRTFGSYALYAVNQSAPRVFAPRNLPAETGLFQPVVHLAGTFAAGANNTTDLSPKGLWSSTTPIARTFAGGFEIHAYWPSPTVRSTIGTGLHFPGWPETTNLPPLNRPIGNFPLAFVNVSGSTNFQPVLWFSTVGTLQEWTTNITAYDRSLGQFFIPPLFAYSFDNATSTRSYVYNLASLSGGVTLHTLNLNHIMVELQPVGDYWGFMNATVSLDLGGPAFTQPSFSPTQTVFAPAAVSANWSHASGAGLPGHLSYTRLDPSDYSVQATATHGPFAVVLLQDYDAHWGITASSGVARTVHFLADGYANGWLVYPSTNSPSFRITFELQAIVTGSGLVSGVAIVGLIALPFVVRYRRRIMGPLRRRREHPGNAVPAGGPTAGGGGGAPPLSVTILLRNLWPGSFARLAIEEAASLPAHGIDPVEVVAFSEYRTGYHYGDLVAARGVRLRVSSPPRLARQLSRLLARPFLPAIRGPESAVPWLEILRWGASRPGGFDVTYGEDQLVGAGALLRRRLHGTPYVLLVAELLATRRGIAVLKVGRDRRVGRVAHWAIHRTELAILRGASALVFVSKRTADRVLAEFPDLRAVPSVTLFPGCHPVDAPNEPTGDSPYVLAVSKWDEGRNPNFFLDIAGQRPEEFVIAGTWIDEGTEARFRARCAQGPPSNGGRLRVTGPLDESQLQATLRGAFCYVHWSPEGFGMGVLEAMGAGVPVICTPDAGAAELVVDGVNGLLVPGRDASAYARAIDRLARDPAFRQSLARGALATAREHDWSHHAERLAAVLRGVATPDPSRADLAG